MLCFFLFIFSFQASGGTKQCLSSRAFFDTQGCSDLEQDRAPSILKLLLSNKETGLSLWSVVSNICLGGTTLTFHHGCYFKAYSTLFLIAKFVWVFELLKDY